MPECPIGSDVDAVAWSGRATRAERQGGRAFARTLLLFAGLLVAGAVLRGQPMLDWLAQAERWGLPVFVLLGALACAIGGPRQVVAFAAGYAHGVWLGVALAMTAQLLGCLLDLLWAGAVSRDWVRARLRGRWGAQFARVEGFMRADPLRATLTLRLLPVGNNLALNLLAGAFGIPAGAFLSASAVGYLPQTLVFVLLGSGIKVAHSVLVGLSLAGLVASMVLGALLLRQSPGQDARTVGQ